MESKLVQSPDEHLPLPRLCESSHFLDLDLRLNLLSHLLATYQSAVTDLPFWSLALRMSHAPATMDDVLFGRPIHSIHHSIGFPSLV